jgi:hypothetical protein
MKRIIQFIIASLFICFLYSCASSKCECETNNKYSKRKSKVSLINYQKNSTFARQKDRIYS